MKRCVIGFVLICVAIGLTGCSSVPNVSLSKDFWDQSNQTVAIATTTKPTAKLYQEGSQGIADIAIADIVTSTFSTYLSNVSLTSFYAINNEAAKKLHSKNIKTISFNESIDPNSLEKSKQNSSSYALRDYTVYSNKLKNDTLLVITIDAVGAERPYYAFIPLGSPKAMCSATGRLINTKTNGILWRKSTETQVAVEGKWDQPPSYPNFTSALQKALKEAKQELLDDFTMQA